MKKNLLFAVIVMFVTVGAMAQENLLLNGDCEEKGVWETVNKYGSDAEFGSFENTPKDGTDGCLNMIGTSGTSTRSELFVYQVITLKVGETYEFSGAVKSGDGCSDGGNPNASYYSQIVMMPVGNWDLADEGDPDWATWGVQNNIVYNVHSRSQESVDGLYSTLNDDNYVGSFLGEDYNNDVLTQGDTTHFTVPQQYAKDPDRSTPPEFEDLGAAGTEVEFYFIIYCGASYGASFEYSVDDLSIKEYSATAVENIAVDNNLSVYPNPVEGIVNVRSATDIHSISVTNIVGQEVLNTNISSNRTANINVSDLNSGVYVVRVVDVNGEILSKKIIKK